MTAARLIGKPVFQWWHLGFGLNVGKAGQLRGPELEARNGDL